MNGYGNGDDRQRLLRLGTLSGWSLGEAVRVVSAVLAGSGVAGGTSVGVILFEPLTRRPPALSAPSAGELRR